jgi:hypothetical protein
MVALDERHSHHEDHSAATPQSKLGLSPAKTQRRKGRKSRKITVKNLLQNNSSLPSELGVLCALAGVNSLCSNISDTRKFAPAAQTFEHSSTKATKGSDILIINFVLFVSFVVRFVFYVLVAVPPLAMNLARRERQEGWSL